MHETRQVLILSVPYCEAHPLVAPVLLAGCLEQAGISAKGIDFNIDFLHEFVDRPYWPDLKNFFVMGHLDNASLPAQCYREVMSYTRRYLANVIQKYQPKYIGLSVFTSESLDFALTMSYLIRRYWPDIKIMAGGKGLEVSSPQGTPHYQTWHKNMIADIIIVGDSEIEIIDTICEGKQGLIMAKKQTKHDMDQIPLAKWQDYDLESYSRFTRMHRPDVKQTEPYLAVTASKGCVRKCSFCDVASFWPEYMFRDPVRVAEEIIHNHRATGIKHFKFTDNLINGSIPAYRIMNQHIIDVLGDRKIKYDGYAIVRGKNHMPAEDFEIAGRAGCWIWHVGIESGSEKVRNDMRKKFTNDDLDWTAEQLITNKIIQNWLMIVGYPTETELDFKDTKELIKRYQHVAPTGLIKIQVTPTFMLLPNSPLLSDPALNHEYGLEQALHQTQGSNRFWISSRNPENDWPTRSRRWKELMALVQDLGYEWGYGMPVKKWTDEVENLDRIYRENVSKVIPIYQYA